MKSVALYLAKFTGAAVMITGLVLLAPFVYALFAWFLGLVFPNTFAAVFELVGWKYSPFLAGLAFGVFRAVVLSFDLVRLPFQVAAQD